MRVHLAPDAIADYRSLPPKIQKAAVVVGWVEAIAETHQFHLGLPILRELKEKPCKYLFDAQSAGK
jgi:hypothetical protein